MNKRIFDDKELTRELVRLAVDVPPRRDLWPDIEAKLTPGTNAGMKAARFGALRSRAIAVWQSMTTVKSAWQAICIRRRSIASGVFFWLFTLWYTIVDIFHRSVMTCVPPRKSGRMLS